jgi:hypothetical protein
MGEKWLKKSNFRALTVRNATALSRNTDFDVICGTRIILRPLIAVGAAGAAGLQKKDAISAFGVIFP